MQEEMQGYDTKRYMTLAEISTQYEIVLSTLRAWRVAGRMPKESKRIGNKLLWDRSVVRDWAKQVTYSPRSGRPLAQPTTDD